MALKSKPAPKSDPAPEETVAVAGDETLLEPAPEVDPEPKAEAPEEKPAALCDVSKCSVVKIKSATATKTLRVAPNMRPELLVFAAEMGPEANLVTGCAEGWSFISAE